MCNLCSPLQRAAAIIAKAALRPHLSSRHAEWLPKLLPKFSNITHNNWFIYQRAFIEPRYEARGKFGEHERCVGVDRGVAESNSSFLSALQTSQVLQTRCTHS